MVFIPGIVIYADSRARIKKKHAIEAKQSFIKVCFLFLWIE
jgi:hypothetical protein